MHALNNGNGNVVIRPINWGSMVWNRTLYLFGVEVVASFSVGVPVLDAESGPPL